MSYDYPIDSSWSTEETIIVVEFLVLIEKAYQSSVARTTLLDQYRQFKKVVPSKSEEKTIGSAFEKSTGYSLYRTIQKAKNDEIKRVSMK